MSSFIALDEFLIKKQLDTNVPSFDFYILQEIDSTNRFLKDLPSNANPAVCCAEAQTQGRGRFGREWSSPFGENIYLSLRWPIRGALSKLSGFSLVIGLSILESFKLNGITQEILIKWPNDLLWKEKKLSGILIELTSESFDSAQAIIGIGINVNSIILNKPWCSLLDIISTPSDRNILVATLLNVLSTNITAFLECGFSQFLSHWKTVDYLKDKNVTVKQGARTLIGKIIGVNLTGELCLEEESGKTHFLSSGDTTLRI